MHLIRLCFKTNQHYFLVIILLFRNMALYKKKTKYIIFKWTKQESSSLVSNIDKQELHTHDLHNQQFYETNAAFWDADKPLKFPSRMIIYLVDHLKQYPPFVSTKFFFFFFPSLFLFSLSFSSFTCTHLLRVEAPQNVE